VRIQTHLWVCRYRSSSLLTLKRHKKLRPATRVCGRAGRVTSPIDICASIPGISRAELAACAGSTCPPLHWSRVEPPLLSLDALHTLPPREERHWRELQNTIFRVGRPPRHGTCVGSAIRTTNSQTKPQPQTNSPTIWTAPCSPPQPPTNTKTQPTSSPARRPLSSRTRRRPSGPRTPSPPASASRASWTSRPPQTRPACANLTTSKFWRFPRSLWLCNRLI